MDLKKQFDWSFDLARIDYPQIENDKRLWNKIGKSLCDKFNYDN